MMSDIRLFEREWRGVMRGLWICCVLAVLLSMGVAGAEERRAVLHLPAGALALLSECWGGGDCYRLRMPIKSVAINLDNYPDFFLMSGCARRFCDFTYFISSADGSYRGEQKVTYDEGAELLKKQENLWRSPEIRKKRKDLGEALRPKDVDATSAFFGERRHMMSCLPREDSSTLFFSASVFDPFEVRTYGPNIRFRVLEIIKGEFIGDFHDANVKGGTFLYGPQFMRGFFFDSEEGPDKPVSFLIPADREDEYRHEDGKRSMWFVGSSELTCGMFTLAPSGKWSEPAGRLWGRDLFDSYARDEQNRLHSPFGRLSPAAFRVHHARPPQTTNPSLARYRAHCIPSKHYVENEEDYSIYNSALSEDIYSFANYEHQFPRSSDIREQGQDYLPEIDVLEFVEEEMEGRQFLKIMFGKKYIDWRKSSDERAVEERIRQQHLLGELEDTIRFVPADQWECNLSGGPGIELTATLEKGR